MPAHDQGLLEQLDAGLVIPFLVEHERQVAHRYCDIRMAVAEELAIHGQGLAVRLLGTLEIAARLQHESQVVQAGRGSGWASPSICRFISSARRYSGSAATGWFNPISAQPRLFMASARSGCTALCSLRCSASACRR